ncbi:hypothetical protein E2C01_005340 [Portunus trituberculatus]|uniref:Uncharacterized protein n=1 Tax=Portunus trituberculatus TaxID=210409 RepID=A0A5B7CWE9_PORTR|nr:hypothetical protein [Portunus trituberculatus]
MTEIHKKTRLDTDGSHGNIEQEKGDPDEGTHREELLQKPNFRPTTQLINFRRYCETFRRLASRTYGIL